MLGTASPWLLLWLALACASVSYTLTKTPMFNWVRTRLPRKWLTVRHLWECPYCMAHWVAFGLVALVRPQPFTGTWVDYPVAAFIIVTLATYGFQLIIMAAEVLQTLRAIQDAKDGDR